MENKSYLQGLGVDRPEDWAFARHEEISKFIVEHTKLMAELSISFLKDQAPMVLALLLLNPQPIREGITNLCQLLFEAGYLKGFYAGEEKGKLEEMWGEEPNREQEGK